MTSGKKKKEKKRKQIFLHKQNLQIYHCYNKKLQICHLYNTDYIKKIRKIYKLTIFHFSILYLVWTRAIL